MTVAQESDMRYPKPSPVKLLLVAVIVVAGADLWSRLAVPTARAAEAPAPMAPKAIDFPPYTKGFRHLRFFHIGIRVKDLERSIAFYRDQLGFRLIRIQDMGISRMAMISTGDGQPVIELQQLKREFPGVSPVPPFHIGLWSDDVDAVYVQTRKQGVDWPFHPGRPGPGAPYLGLAVDPDGNHVEIMENPGGPCESCHRNPHLD
jgi:catechol 2,3-dioxygenase-like lactoylglutathione lyase family enzyme